MIGSVFLDKQTEEARRSYWQDIWIWREKKNRNRLFNNYKSSLLTLTYQSLNWALPSRKCSSKQSAKCKTSILNLSLENVQITIFFSSIQLKPIKKCWILQRHKDNILFQRQIDNWIEREEKRRMLEKIWL